MTDSKTRADSVTPPPARREAARKKAQDHFSATERRDSEVRREIERQHAAAVVQMTKLRALRLAKEEADRIAAANAPPTKSRKTKRT
jgi:hypothetical protein